MIAIATTAHRRSLSVSPMHGVPTPEEIRRTAGAIRRNWTPAERVQRQYVADLRQQSLLRAATRSAA